MRVVDDASANRVHVTQRVCWFKPLSHAPIPRISCDHLILPDTTTTSPALPFYHNDHNRHLQHKFLILNESSIVELDTTHNSITTQFFFLD